MRITSFHFAFWVLWILLLTSFVVMSCTCHKEEVAPLPYNHMNVPPGETAVVADINQTGRGSFINQKHTTWLVRGAVFIDALEVKGQVVVEEGARLNVATGIRIYPGAQLIIERAAVKGNELKQSGSLHLKKADLCINRSIVLEQGSHAYTDESLIRTSAWQAEGDLEALSGSGFSVVWFLGHQAQLSHGSKGWASERILFTRAHNEIQGGKQPVNCTQEIRRHAGWKNTWNVPEEVDFYRFEAGE